jgi:heterodisulfide reductase subunit D
MTEKRYSFAEGLSRRQLIELDACTRCSECLKWCPVQEVTGRREISPPEKIRLYREFIVNTEGLKARLFGGKVDRRLLEDFVRAVYECTTCGACGEVCEVGIFSQRLWPVLRRKMVEMGLGPIGPQANLPKFVKETGNVYNKPPQERFKPWFPEGVKVHEKAEIGYYAGCTGCYEAQPMVRGDVLVLHATGYAFTMLPSEEEVCCGFPLFITGQWELLEDLVKRLVSAYEARGVKLLLSSCPCCVNIMARDWPSLYGKPLPFKIRHISQFVAEAIRSGRLIIKRSLRERIIYHDPCYLSRGVGVIEEPRYVLRSIPFVELIEFERHGLNSRCCGAGGAARKVFHENAIKMGRLTIDEAVEKGADRLILSCPACYSKMHEAMEGYERQIRITDIMELIGSLL